MFTNLLSFEVKNRLWRLSSLAYFLVYFALSFLLAITFAGAFKGATVSFGFSNKLALNSPIILNFLISFIGYFGLLVVAPLFGQSIYKDFEDKFSQIIFATPIKKRTYFAVRYLGSVISSVVILSSAAFGILVASWMPFVDSTLIGSNHLWFYVSPYLTNVIPNVLIFGAVFIAVASFFKKMAPVYIASIAVFTGWLIAQTLTSDLENKFVAAMVEPFGLEAASQVTRYWSLAQQSTLAVPVTGVFLYNRLIWAGIGLAFLTFAYLVFNPFQLASEKKKKSETTTEPVSRFSIPELPAVHLEVHSWKVFLGLAWSEFRQAFSNIYFIMILLCGLVYIFSLSGQVGKIFGTETYPVTYQVLEIIGGSFSLFMVILTTFYAGELVWKERDQHFYELVDSKPVSNLYLYLSKILSLFLVQIFLSIVVIVSCVLIQTFKGYFNFEWNVYFEHLFVYALPARLMVCILALFIHNIVKQKYIGHSVIIFVFILTIWLPSAGFDHHLYLLSELPRASYSDMNHFGTSAWPFTVFAVYWGFFHLAIAVATVLLWRRGAQQSFKIRWQEARRRIQPIYRNLLVISALGFVLTGSYIFYNTNILNHYQSKTTTEQNQVQYEKEYKKFEKMPSPQIISVQLNVDIFPDTQSVKTRGTFKYKNTAKDSVGEFLLTLNRNIDESDLQWSVPVKLISDNRRLEVRTYQFEKPLAPNEEFDLNFSTVRQPRGFKNESFNKKILQNGTFIYGTDIAPFLGYNRDAEIEEEKTRRKYNLPERPRMYDVNDKEALQRTYISGEGNWIRFDATVSTSKDQTAIAPGYLEKDWMEGDRHYFHYNMDRPILNFYAFQSARYAVTKDHWNDVSIEVYHHPSHNYDVDRMIKSVKAALDYYSKNFSAYQYRQVRIIEFPRYEHFAQSFPNTIPFSEAIGFIAKVNPKDPESIDYPFYVTAHEVAHQWWAHQVIGGNVQGSTMLSESLAQYSSLMVQEKEYGPRQMKKFLKYELDKYLNGRSHETKQEQPLMLNENQQYIHYEKGSLVFYALKDYLGEATVNKVLHDYILDVAFQQPPFTRSVDLVERFRKAAPPELQYLIQDLFETITFYDNRTESVQYKKVGSKYEVTIQGFSKKTRADGQGKETEIAMNDFIDVGLFDKDGKILYLKKHRLTSGENKLTVEVDEPPYRGGIDPLNKLIDKVSDDNLIRATAL